MAHSCEKLELRLHFGPGPKSHGAFPCPSPPPHRWEEEQLPASIWDMAFTIRVALPPSQTAAPCPQRSRSGGGILQAGPGPQVTMLRQGEVEYTNVCLGQLLCQDEAESI